MLDKSKPYGEVYGGGAGHRYEQDGQYFDHEGKPSGTVPGMPVAKGIKSGKGKAPAVPDVVAAPVAPDAVAAPAAPDAAEDQLAKQLGA